MEAYVEIHESREKEKWIRDAWFTACTIMAWTGKEVDPSSLLPEWVAPKKILTKAEKDKELKDLKKELKIKD